MLPAAGGDVAGYAKVDDHKVFGGEGVRFEAANDDETAALVDVMAGFVEVRTESGKREVLASYLVTVKALIWNGA